jgi:hypothetical protein
MQQLFPAVPCRAVLCCAVQSTDAELLGFGDDGEGDSDLEDEDDEEDSDDEEPAAAAAAGEGVQGSRRCLGVLG